MNLRRSKTIFKINKMKTQLIRGVFKHSHLFKILYYEGIFHIIFLSMLV